MPSNVMIPVLVTMMLLTGVCNTLLTKYQDLQCVRNCNDPNPGRRKMFEQPVIQTAQMFIGEMGCWLVVAGFSLYRRLSSKEQRYTHLRHDSTDNLPDHEDTSAVLKPLVAKEENRTPLRGWSTLLLALPACCDITGTTLMNVGLLYVAASIYQMTRGALVLFVGLFSVIFLHRKLYLYQWTALVVVVLGVGIVGLAGAIAPNPQAKPEPRSLVEVATLVIRAGMAKAKTPGALQTILGVLMIAGAQIFTATQFVLEEWILERYAIEPLKMVGWEGLFGFTVTVIGMIILHFAVGRSGQHEWFDAVEGLRQVTHYKNIAISSVLIMISIGGFNFFGLSVTRTVSATSRSTIDTCRTLFIWIVSLALHWETFKWLQIVGFVLLVYGTFLFNDIVGLPFKKCTRRRKAEPLLPEEPIEHS